MKKPTAMTSDSFEDQPLFVQIGESVGIRGILHTDYGATCVKLARPHDGQDGPQHSRPWLERKEN